MFSQIARQLAGPIIEAGASWIPGLSQIKAALRALVLGLVLIAGAFSGFTLRGWGMSKEIAAAAKPLCEAATTKARLAELEDSVKEHQDALRDRETRLGDLTTKLAELERKKQELLNGKANPDHSTRCVSPDDPWVRPLQKR